MESQRIRQDFDQAIHHHQAGRLPEAQRFYLQVLAGNPQHPDATHNLGVIALQMGRNADAVDLMRRAVSLRAEYFQAWCNLGYALRTLGQLPESIAACERAVAIKPDYAEAYLNLGNALHEAGRLDEAAAAFERVIALNPTIFFGYYNLGNVRKDQQLLDEAIAAYRKAIELKPDYVEAHNNLGTAFSRMGRTDEAIESYRRAIAVDPNSAQAHFNLGTLLREEDQLDEAIAVYRRAVALRPDYAEAHYNLGNALNDRGQLDEAIASYRRTIAVKPDYAEAYDNLLFALHYHAGSDARTIAAEHQRWAVQFENPLRRQIPIHTNRRDRDRRLRIGYVAPDFRRHCQSFFTVPLLSHHDHQNFEIVCYSDVARPDEMTGQLQSYTDVWRVTAGVGDEQLAKEIIEDQIDILVDLTMHMRGNRLLVFARKPAPVQICWLAYPGSTGLSAIDYRLSDPYLDPPGGDESLYSEKTIRLPDTFWCYDPLDGRDVGVNSLPALETGFVTFGCLNRFWKVNDGILSLWSHVLKQAEDSRFILLVPNGSARQRVLKHFSLEGIDPARIELVAFQPRQSFLKTFHRMDVCLDSFPYNGHTTSLDAFWMGVPVVTLVGQHPLSRAGWSQLSNLGMPELAGQTPEQFERIAVELAGDLSRLAELRRTLRPRMEQSPLMDAPRFARNIEAAYRNMWHAWCASGTALG